jgi:hypothetical protein
MERMLEKRGSLLSLWGILGDSESIAEIESEIRKMRIKGNGVPDEFGPGRLSHSRFARQTLSPA